MESMATRKVHNTNSPTHTCTRGLGTPILYPSKSLPFLSLTMAHITVSTAALNQWALDFDGNLHRIKASIEQAKRSGASYRVGPELETTGYGCEDHFLESDTVYHSWQVISKLIPLSHNFLIDVGAPVIHRSTRYNCRVLLLNQQIVLIRPKTVLADDGNYRESRWFSPWSPHVNLQQFVIPKFVRAETSNGASHCPFGARVVLEDSLGICLGFEICEELWAPHSNHVDTYLAGAHIVSNGSASHHQLRKLQTRIDLICNATRNSGGLYLYSNQRGCDGGRLYYDGVPLVAMNGKLLSRGSQFSLESDVEVITVTVNVGDVDGFRAGLPARGMQSTNLSTGGNEFERIVLADFEFSSRNNAPRSAPPLECSAAHSVAEEIAYGPACWLWDYLRRSRMRGFFLPLSGGADSCATAVIVGCMCQLLDRAIKQPDCEQRLLEQVRFACGLRDDEALPDNARELASKLIVTMYMGSERASSAQTRARACDVAEQIGSAHYAVEIDGAVAALLAIVGQIFGAKLIPRFRADGGTNTENLALQNVQARIRMVLSYLFAQLANWARGREGSLLVLGSANVDESLRGYLTKYDCSSADLNPIGGVSKKDLRLLLEWSAHSLGYTCVLDVVRAKPSAELEPIVNGSVQVDEVDMGMSYDELTIYGRLRKISRCGPLSMFCKLREIWRDLYSMEEISDKVKYFWTTYSINRHKVTTLTPSYHAENYSPEDNRFDLRQFLYRTSWRWQFREIDALVSEEKKE